MATCALRRCITEQQESAPCLNHFSASARPPAPQVIRQVTKMLETSAKGAQPRGEEAQRVLSTFAASLKNPTLVSPPVWTCVCVGRTGGWRRAGTLGSDLTLLPLLPAA